MSIDLVPRLVAFSRPGSVAPSGESTSGRRGRAKAWRVCRRVWSVSAVLLVLGATWYVWPASRGGRATIVFVSGNSMEPTYSTDDVVVARRQDSYRVGDVIVYRIDQGDAGAGHLVIHRITGATGTAGGRHRATTGRMRMRGTRRRLRSLVGPCIRRASADNSVQPSPSRSRRGSGPWPRRWSPSRSPGGTWARRTAAGPDSHGDLAPQRRVPPSQSGIYASMPRLMVGPSSACGWVG